MSAIVIRERRQTTVPAEVCEALDIHADDQVEWRVEGGKAIMRKLQPGEPEVIDLADVPKDGILPRGFCATSEAVAQAVREERDGP